MYVILKNKLYPIPLLMVWILLTVYPCMAGESIDTTPESTKNQSLTAEKTPAASVEEKESQDQRIKIISQAFKAFMQTKPVAPSNLKIVSGP